MQNNNIFKMTTKKKRQHPEADLQKECINWYKQEYPTGLIFSVPNEGVKLSMMNHFKQMGMYSGSPDLVALKENGDVLFIELKSEKGKLSPNQKETQTICDNLNADLYHVVRDIETFKYLFSKRYVKKVHIKI